MKYFAYGSNMSLRRLEARLKNVEPLGVFCLPQHRLAFHKASVDGSAKCDAFFSSNLDDKMLGVVYEISDDDKETLDHIEGVGYGYDQKSVELIDELGNRLNAYLYYATETDSDREPYDWYHYHVLAGAHEARLPADYIEQILTFETKADASQERFEREIAIYSLNPLQLENDLSIRRCLPREEHHLWQLFYTTIRQINIRDYSEEQVTAWAPDSYDPQHWVKRMRKIHPFVALLDNQIVGYADVQPSGYIDHFFCHHQHQEKGIGKQLFNQLLNTAMSYQLDKIFTHASQTAKPFFESRGFKLKRPQTVDIRGVKLNNYVLEMDLK